MRPGAALHQRNQFAQLRHVRRNFVGIAELFQDFRPADLPPAVAEGTLQVVMWFRHGLLATRQNVPRAGHTPITELALPSAQ